MLPHTLSHWALQLADRLVIAGLVSATSLGVYTLAATIATPLQLLVVSLNQGFMPTYARSGTKSGSVSELRRIVLFQITAVTALTLAGALLGGPVADILAPPSYGGASTLIPWIVLGYGFLGLYVIPMNGATLGAGRTRRVWAAYRICRGKQHRATALLRPDLRDRGCSGRLRCGVSRSSDRDLGVGAHATKPGSLRMATDRPNARRCSRSLRGSLPLTPTIRILALLRSRALLRSFSDRALFSRDTCH